MKVQLERKALNLSCSEDQDIISAATMYGIDLPNSCFGELVQNVHPRYWKDLLSRKMIWG